MSKGSNTVNDTPTWHQWGKLHEQKPASCGVGRHHHQRPSDPCQICYNFRSKKGIKCLDWQHFYAQNQPLMGCFSLGCCFCCFKRFFAAQLELLVRFQTGCGSRFTASTVPLQSPKPMRLNPGCWQ